MKIKDRRVETLIEEMDKLVSTEMNKRKGNKAGRKVYKRKQNRNITNIPERFLENQDERYQGFRL